MRRCIYVPYFQNQIRLNFDFDPTNVSLLTPSYLGCIFTLAARGASVDLRFEYVNELDTPIHERNCARVKLPLLYEAQPMQSMDVGKHIFLRKLYMNGAVRRLRSRHRHWAGVSYGVNST